ncbi:hypothetical protein [Rhizobium acidisoli]|uniref:hypothetical protein n=1 Tax=Rhizobium acidisoli TaxID=1538158 RepID=UPI001FD87A77|nr:hypothetical protein [Rhizobium acidisoli]
MPERERPQPDLVRIDGGNDFHAGNFRKIHGMGICPSSGSENDQAHLCPHLFVELLAAKSVVFRKRPTLLPRKRSARFLRANPLSWRPRE